MRGIVLNWRVVRTGKSCGCGGVQIAERWVCLGGGGLVVIMNIGGVQALSSIHAYVSKYTRSALC